jgi:hypothetical protein
MSIETLLIIYVISLLIERQPIPKIKYKKTNSSTWAYTILNLATLFLFNFTGVATFDLALVLTLRGCDLDYFTSYDQFWLWSPSHFISWLNRDWHLVICDSSWLAWFLELNIHLPFSITYSTSTSRLPLALLRCMVYRGQVLVNPSSIVILSHTIFHVFHRLILEKLIFMIKLLSYICNT